MSEEEQNEEDVVRVQLVSSVRYGAKMQRPFRLQSCAIARAQRRR